MRYLVVTEDGEIAESFFTLKEAKRFISEDVADPSDYTIFDTENEVYYHTNDRGATWTSDVLWRSLRHLAV